MTKQFSTYCFRNVLNLPKYGMAILLVASLSAACNSTTNKTEGVVNQEISDNVPLSKIEFSSTNFDFGKIAEGEIVERTYTFTNIGEHDVWLREVKPSCGCTTPEFTKDAIKPGKQGKITVKFDSKGRIGNQSKQITVITNTEPASTILRFTAQVLGNK